MFSTRQTLVDRGDNERKLRQQRHSRRRTRKEWLQQPEWVQQERLGMLPLLPPGCNQGRKGGSGQTRSNERLQSFKPWNGCPAEAEKPPNRAGERGNSPPSSSASGRSSSSRGHSAHSSHEVLHHVGHSSAASEHVHHGG